LGAMIPTIRSRCRVAQFHTPSSDQFDLLLNRLDSQLLPEQRHLLATISDKSIGLCQQILDQGGLDIIERLHALLAEQKLQWSALHHFAEEIGRKNDEGLFDLIARILDMFVTNAIYHVVGKGGNDLPILPIFQGKDLYALTHIHQQLQNVFSQAKIRNLDKRQAILNALDVLKN